MKKSSLKCTQIYVVDLYGGEIKVYLCGFTTHLKGHVLVFLYPLYSGNPQTSIFANSKDPDEMQHNAAFHQSLHCL